MLRGGKECVRGRREVREKRVMLVILLNKHVPLHLHTHLYSHILLITAMQTSITMQLCDTHQYDVFKQHMLVHDVGARARSGQISGPKASHRNLGKYYSVCKYEFPDSEMGLHRTILIRSKRFWKGATYGWALGGALDL